MRRIAIGAVTGLAIWFGSAMVAEAQGITPNGPTAVVAGSTSSTYTASVYLPTPCIYVVRLWVMRGTTELHYSQTVVPNPGTSYTTFVKDAGFNQAIYAGDQLIYKVAMKVAGVWTPANYPVNGETINYGPITVSATRPTGPTSVQKAPGSVKKSPTLALQSIDRDRRRE